ncbi:MAG TPA: hypothetical protein VNI79_04545 [Sphingomicrobium sp.]|nr:hypothetical protein [Sphingomicrobium sp.]
MTRTVLMLSSAMLLIVAGCNRQDAPGNDSAGEMNQSAAATSIDGTWKVDLASAQIEEKPYSLLLKDGTYSCSTCEPPLTVAADGAFHAVPDRPYYDSISVKTVDDKTVMTVRKKGDRIVGETTRTVAADGKSMTVNASDSSTPGTTPILSKATETRVESAPAGAHAISGSWKTAKIDSVSDEGLKVTFRLDGETLNMNGAGQSYAAKLDGSDTPIKGDIGGTIVSVERVAPNIFRETFKRDGKVRSVNTMTIGEDGKMSILSEDKIRTGSSRYTATRQ